MCEDSADNKQGGVLALQPEQQARGKIDVLLEAAGWHVCDAAAANNHSARGVVIRQLIHISGHGLTGFSPCS
jgi:type I restriction enzyme R subunit